jgi:pimeloyl-ACP methyl ester carboxylesterase
MGLKTVIVVVKTGDFIARMIRLFIIMVVLFAVLAVPPAMARMTISSGTQGSGAIYRIDVPDSLANWNGDLIVFAHGFVRPDKPLAIPEDQLSVSGQYIPDLVTGMGYAFAVTSYSKNGLAVVQGMEDVLNLVEVFKNVLQKPLRVFLAGVSEGGLISTLAVEKHPEIFSGGLALSGPIGDFRSQINYMGDFRVGFDYFFPGLLPPTPISIPQDVMENWYSIYVPEITQAINGNTNTTNQLLIVTLAPTDPNNWATRAETALDILWYNVFGTNDAITTLGGQPFDNRNRLYIGSNNDFALNFGVERFQADLAALNEIQSHYQTSGKLRRPLVSMHTTLDPVVPYWHEALYLEKVVSNGSLLNFFTIPISRYGHSNFTASEVLAGFALLVNRVKEQDPRSRARMVGAISLLLLE